MTTSPEESSAAPTHPPGRADLWVLCLCADWCHICRDMRAALTDDHRLMSLVNWHWVDVEDHADILDDLSVETFPSYLIGTNDEALLFAPGPPHGDAIRSFLMPYATGRMKGAAVTANVQRAFLAMTARLSTL